LALASAFAALLLALDKGINLRDATFGNIKSEQAHKNNGKHKEPIAIDEAMVPTLVQPDDQTADKEDKVDGLFETHER